MPPFIEQLAIGFGTEIIYSFVIIVCSLMIYFGTKELYELSSYGGIKYFRKAFLFFGIAYFFRSFIKFLLSYFNIRRIIDFAPVIFGDLSLFFFMYFSSMAVFYLICSLMLKRWNNNSRKIYLFHAISLVISLIVIMLKSALVYLWLNIFILLFVIITFYISNKGQKKKKKNNLYAIYALLFVFWILNVIDILIPDFFQNVQLFIYTVSIGIFLTILYKVLKKSGSD
jgi:hypothetical protein